jgi:hypothetical protein
MGREAQALRKEQLGFDYGVRLRRTAGRSTRATKNRALAMDTGRT